MKNLKELLKDIDYEVVKGDLDIEINDIKDNSKAVQEGDLFVAVVGTAVDSHEFIPSAIENGAKVIVIEKDVEVEADVTVIKVKSSRKALSLMSASYFDYPATKMTTIGITGTCGKTSTSYIIRSIFKEAGNKVGLIGTIEALIDDEKVETHNTTPNAYELQKLFSEMVEKGCKYVVMEVSSQGLKMDRVAGIEFDIGIFTNLSNDHIAPNEHENMEEYTYYKSLLFKQCKKGIINVDSDKWLEVTKDHTCSIIKFGLDSEDTDYKANDINFIVEDDFLGVEFDVEGRINDRFKLDIPGKFSVYNALSAIATAVELGVDSDSIKRALLEVKVSGRVELVSSNDKYKLIIDYAHNRDEMNNLMEAISKLKPQRLVSIFGGGGNRAKDRRYDMGEVAGKWSDLVILTEDCPRFEEIESINNDIIVGLSKYDCKHIFIKDRKEAIKYALKNAEKGDIILLLGIGHMTYREIKGVKEPWSEIKAVKEAEAELKAEEILN